MVPRRQHRARQAQQPGDVPGPDGAGIAAVVWAAWAVVRFVIAAFFVLGASGPTPSR